MTKLLQRTEVTLRSFYIFNSTFCQTEGEEHKKILYYYPNEIELNTKIKDVGLSQAIIHFTGSFTSDDNCKALHTQKTTQLFYQAEPGFWLVLVINVPKVVKSKDGIDVAEYRGVEVCDRIYHAVLRQCYHTYCFQHGTFQGKLSAGTSTAELDMERQQLSNHLHQFYDKYITTLQDLEHCDVMDMMHSIQYLPLEKSMFLRAHNFSSMLSATFPVIKDTTLLYNEQVVCSGKLTAGDLYSLHAYILEHVLEVAPSGTHLLTRTSSGSDASFQNGGFVKVASDQSPFYVKVYLALGNNIEPHKLLIYRAINITMCLLVDDSDKDVTLRPEFYEELHAYMGPQLTSLSREISSEVSKQAVANVALNNDSTNADAPKYLFINEHSLKHHTNIFRHIKGTQHSLPQNVMSIISDLGNPKENLDSLASSTEELQVKTTNDYWIVKRRCNWRQYYVVLSNSKATLLDVSHEAKRIFEQELTDDVFFDK